MVSRLLQELHVGVFGPLSGRNNLFQLFDDGHDDTSDFPRTTAPRIVDILIVALVPTQLLKRGIEALERAQQIAQAVGHMRPQICTLSSVIYSVGVFVTMFLAAMQIRSQANINLWSAARRLGPRHRLRWADAGNGFH